MQGLMTLNQINAAASKVRDHRLSLRAERVHHGLFVFTPDGYSLIRHSDSVLPSTGHPKIEVEYLGQQTPLGADKAQAAFKVTLNGIIRTGLTRQQAIDLVLTEEGISIEPLLNDHFNEA
jgi:hypothetical protein